MLDKTWFRNAAHSTPSLIEKIILFVLLLSLNVTLRLPSIPHEKGYDSFLIHSLANSVSIYGDAQWWVNWLSVFGFYAYSYASAVPFVLSGIHQLTSIEMEKVILIYCVITGLISIFTAYVLAGRFSSNFIFKYGVALFFSIAPGIMTFTTWEVSTRGMFIVLFPLFIYLLLSNLKNSKKLFFIIVLLVFLFSVHHYAFLLFPVMFVYIFLLILQKTNSLSKITPYTHYLVIGAILLFVGLPFFSRSLIDSGSRYGWLITSMVTIGRQIGPMMILAASGFVYTLFKKSFSTTELFLIATITMFVPTIYSHTYGAYFLLLFLILFIGISFKNVVFLPSNRKLVSLLLLVFILSTVIFTGFYNHHRTGDSDDYWYMKHETYVTGLWGRNYVPASYGLDIAFETSRVFAVSEGHPITPSIGAVNLAYGFINASEIEYDEHSFTEKEFYFEGPYTVKQGTTVAGQMEWIRLTVTSIDQLTFFDYFVQDKYYPKQVTNVVTKSYNKVYDNSRMAIWYYDQKNNSLKSTSN
jgi:hypothetical protein